MVLYVGDRTVCPALGDCAEMGLKNWCALVVSSH
jgi:hypothetical protein